MKRVIIGLIAASTLFAFPVDAVAAVPDHVSWSGSYIDPHFLQCEGFEIVSAPAAKALQRCSSTWPDPG